MITLHILKALQDAGFGTIDTDLFLEEVPIDSKGNSKDGMWIVTRGAPVTRFTVQTQSFDIYSRYSDKLTGYKNLENVLEWIQESFEQMCTLGPVPSYSEVTYNKVRIVPTSSVENVGTDENNKVVRVISGTVQFERSL